MSGAARSVGRAGLYGKAPGHGDFLCRGLPGTFVAPWDNWLGGWLAYGRHEIGDAFERAFLTSPVWRFLLAPGLCGPQGWAGVLLPSHDKVGRCFPLTIALPVPVEDDMVRLLDEWAHGFSLMEEAGRALRDGNMPFEPVVARLHELERSAPLPPPYRPPNSTLRRGGEARARRVAVDELVSTILARDLLAAQFADAATPHSLWWRLREGSAEGSCIMCRGLPPEESVRGFLCDEWAEAPWCVPARSAGS